MKSNIALIGFMGTGKTAVGQVLAKRLNRQLIEIDAVIEKSRVRQSPIFLAMMAKFIFRELEIEAIKQASNGEKQVIACGGGAVLNTINIDRLRATGVIINLIAAPKTILKRTSGESGSRPLLKSNSRWNESRSC